MSATSSQLPAELDRLRARFVAIAAQVYVGDLPAEEVAAQLSVLGTVDGAGCLWRIDPSSTPSRITWLRQAGPQPPVPCPPGLFVPPKAAVSGAVTHVPLAPAPRPPVAGAAPATGPGTAGAGFGRPTLRSLAGTAETERRIPSPPGPQPQPRRRTVAPVPAHESVSVSTESPTRSSGRPLLALAVVVIVAAVTSVLWIQVAPLRASSDVPDAATMETVVVALNGPEPHSVIVGATPGDAAGVELRAVTAAGGKLRSGGAATVSDGQVVSVVEQVDPSGAIRRRALVTWINDGQRWLLGGWPTLT